MRWRHFACPDTLSLLDIQTRCAVYAAGILSLLGNRASALCGLSEVAVAETTLNFGSVGQTFGMRGNKLSTGLWKAHVITRLSSKR